MNSHQPPHTPPNTEHFRQKSNPRLIFWVFLLIGGLSIFFVYRSRKDLTKNEKMELEEAIEELTREESEQALTVPLATSEEVFSCIQRDDCAIVDLRSAENFQAAHIESSVNFPLEEIDSKIEKLDKRKKIFLVDQTDSSEGRTAADRLIRSGYKVKYLKGGITEYRENDYGLVSFGNPQSAEDRSKVLFINREKLTARVASGENFIFLDVRKSVDFEKKHIRDPINIPLENLEEQKKEIPLGKLVVVDEIPFRAFQACVRLFDLNILGALCYEDDLKNLENESPAN